MVTVEVQIVLHVTVELAHNLVFKQIVEESVGVGRGNRIILDH